MSTDTTKACVMTPATAAVWRGMVAAGEFPHRGMVLDSRLTGERLDNSLVFTLPAENVDAFLDDLNEVLGRLGRQVRRTGSAQ